MNPAAIRRNGLPVPGPGVSLPICGGCRDKSDEIAHLESRLREAEQDYFDVIQANTRLVMFLKMKGHRLPAYTKMRKLFPLDHQRVFAPRFTERKMAPAVPTSREGMKGVSAVRKKLTKKKRKR